MLCEQAAQIHAYHDGELSPSSRLAAQAHLRECAQCRRLLEDLRRLSSMVTEASLPELPDGSVRRLVVAWRGSRDREVRRLATWMTVAAAVVLAGSLLIRPAELNKPVTGPGSLDAVAAMLPIEPHGDAGVETIQLAQWIADDLSHGAMREAP